MLFLYLMNAVKHSVVPPTMCSTCFFDVSDPQRREVYDQSKEKQLPQHDFCEAKAHQTPSSFPFINGKSLSMKKIKRSSQCVLKLTLEVQEVPRSGH